jgi:hypothetical protein
MWYISNTKGTAARCEAKYKEDRMDMCKQILRLQEIASADNINKDCGEQLYADFMVTDSDALDVLEAALNQQRPAENLEHNTTSASVPARSYTPANTGWGATSNVHPSRSQMMSTSGPGIDLNVVQADPTNERDSPPRYFAVCIPAGGIYKALNEIDMSTIKSDAGLFSAIQKYTERAEGKLDGTYF